jgi:hypothetical protein
LPPRSFEGFRVEQSRGSLPELLVGLDGAECTRHAPNRVRTGRPLQREFLARNGVDWLPPSTEETVATIEGVAAGSISARALADWLRASGLLIRPAPTAPILPSAR